MVSKLEEVNIDWKEISEMVNVSPALTDLQKETYNHIIKSWLKKAQIYAGDYDNIYPEIQNPDPADNEETKKEFSERFEKIKKGLEDCEAKRKEIKQEINDMWKILNNTEELITLLKNQSTSTLPPADNSKLDEILTLLKNQPTGSTTPTDNTKLDEILTLIKNPSKPPTEKAPNAPMPVANMNDKIDEIIKWVRFNTTKEQIEATGAIGGSINRLNNYFRYNNLIINWRNKYPTELYFYNYSEVDKWVEGIKKDIESGKNDANFVKGKRIIFLPDPIIGFWGILQTTINKSNEPSLTIYYYSINETVMVREQKEKDIRAWLIGLGLPVKQNTTVYCSFAGGKDINSSKDPCVSLSYCWESIDRFIKELNEKKLNNPALLDFSYTNWIYNDNSKGWKDRQLQNWLKDWKN